MPKPRNFEPNSVVEGEVVLITPQVSHRVLHDIANLILSCLSLQAQHGQTYHAIFVSWTGDGQIAIVKVSKELTQVENKADIKILGIIRSYRTIRYQ